MADLLNISVNSTLSRSIITHVTVTLALLALFFFGGHAIHSFTATMIFGVVLVGTYTSIFIAAPILIYLGVGTARLEAEKERKAISRTRFQGKNRAGQALTLWPGSPQAPALSAAGADRQLRQGRLSLRRHVASRLAAVPAERHLGLAGERRRRRFPKADLAQVFADAARDEPVFPGDRP